MQSTVVQQTDEHMRCPTCNAAQVWSEQCRRCKCDLSLLWRAHRTAERERRQCLLLLRQRRPGLALRHARRFAALAGTAQAEHLVGACLLLCGNWPDACSLAQRADLHS